MSTKGKQSKSDNESTGLRVISFVAENVKRLRAVLINPSQQDPLVIIGGHNAQGKTSVLDALASAIGGQRWMQSEPVRQGQERAETSVDLGELVITRRWTPDGRSQLEVRSADGVRVKSPQAVLDEMCCRLSIDPLEFARARPADRVTMLCEVIGLDISAMDARRQAAYDERTAIGHDVRRLEGVLSDLPVPPDDTPTEEVSLSALSMQLEAASQAHHQLDSLARTASAAEREVHRIEGEIKRAEAALKALKESLEVSRQRFVEAEAEQKVAQEDGLPDLDEIRDQIATAEALNRRVSQARQWRAVRAELAEKKRARDQQTERIEAIDAEKAAALATSSLPLDGLALGETDVLYQGIPLEQASSAEKLRVSTAIAMAANPTIRVIWIEDGSLLDEGNLEILREMAADKGYQIWVERVGTGDEVSVIIEDGVVACGKKLDTGRRCLLERDHAGGCCG